ncbi:hypothetical protein Tco_0004928 [Tanacetum coccineum]
MGTTCCGVHSIIALGVIGWGTTFRGGTYSLLMSVLGGDNLRGVIFFTARVFLEGTPVMGTYGFHYCPGVLGGDTYDGYIEHRFHELRVIIEKLKKEKESNQIKIDNFENASKSLDKLIGSQISDNNRKGVGYNVVPPPPTGLFAPPTIDLSNSGLKEFQLPEFEGYGVKTICPKNVKKRKGKSKSTNGGQFTGLSVKHNVRYEPKATISAPKKGTTYVEEEDEEDVENVYDESANLIQNKKDGGSSSFTAAAG